MKTWVDGWNGEDARPSGPATHHVRRHEPMRSQHIHPSRPFEAECRAADQIELYDMRDKIPENQSSGPRPLALAPWRAVRQSVTMSERLTRMSSTVFPHANQYQDNTSS